MRRRKKPQAEEGGGAPGYMTTWGDMMSLLLCFFILLYSFSSLDNQRFREIMVAFKNMAGFLDGGTNLIPEGYNSEELSPFADSSQIQLQSLEALAAVIQDLLEEEGFRNIIIT